MSVSAGSLPLSVRRRLVWLGRVTTFLALLGALLPGDPAAAAEPVEITGQARVLDGDSAPRPARKGGNNVEDLL